MSSIKHSLPGADDIHRVVLPNGITVLSRENFNSPSVVVSGYLHAGGLLDPDEKLGLADFVASALMRGTQKRDFQKLYDELESVGASFGYNSGTHYVSLGGRSLAEDLPLLLDVLADTLQNPVFPKDQIEKLRAQMLTGLAIRAQDTSDMASLTFDEVLFEGHPYSRPDEGWPETVQAITLGDMMDFHRRYYGPHGMVISIVGAVEPEKALGEVERVLGGWRNPHQLDLPKLPPLKKIMKETNRQVYISEKPQASIIIGTLGPSRTSPDYLPALLGNNILGQFGLLGRIGMSIREQSGLAYFAYSVINSGIGPGSWEVVTDCAPSNINKVIEVIRSELEKFVTVPVALSEIKDSQAFLSNSLPLKFESNNSVASACLNIERYSLGMNYYREFPKLIKSVTPEMILDVSQHYFNLDRIVTVIAGSVSGS